MPVWTSGPAEEPGSSVEREGVGGLLNCNQLRYCMVRLLGCAREQRALFGCLVPPIPASCKYY